MKATKDIEVDLCHWSYTVVSYDKYLDGYPLVLMLPELPLGHGIKLRVTVEVIDKGIPCSVRKWKDKGCTKNRKRKKIKME